MEQVQCGYGASTEQGLCGYGVGMMLVQSRYGDGMVLVQSGYRVGTEMLCRGSGPLTPLGTGVHSGPGDLHPQSLVK